MIYLTRLNGDKIMVNVDMLEMLEETPDTVVTLTTGKKIVVKESTRQIREQVIAFRKLIETRLKK
ncbi:MAG: flagellar FlbD family protein [Syntrophomonadaceae bacterium]|nr:flagellar FlbD family protein [Bacillota bacterium]NLP25528.1 flagellar FlbD family protein [Syntrophomonadaceae bacterium]